MSDVERARLRKKYAMAAEALFDAATGDFWAALSSHYGVSLPPNTDQGDPAWRRCYVKALAKRHPDRHRSKGIPEQIEAEEDYKAIKNRYEEWVKEQSEARGGAGEGFFGRWDRIFRRRF